MYTTIDKNQASRNVIEIDFSSVTVWKKKPLPKNRTLGEEIPDNQWPLTIVS